MAVIDVISDIKRVIDVLLSTGLVSDIVDGRDDIPVSINAEISFGIHMETTEVKYELVIEEDPNIIISAKPELLSTVSGDFHRDTHMGCEMKVMTLLCGGVIVRKVDVV